MDASWSPVILPRLRSIGSAILDSDVITSGTTARPYTRAVTFDAVLFAAAAAATETFAAASQQGETACCAEGQESCYITREH